MTTADGFVARPDGALDWVLWGEDMDRAALTLLQTADAFVRSAMLDQQHDPEAFIETLAPEKLGWAQTEAQQSYANTPAIEDYAGLLREFPERLKLQLAEEGAQA